MAGIRNDRFGNPTLLKFAKSVISKKDGNVMPIFKTYVEIGSTMVKVEISHAKDGDKKNGNPGMWVKFTKMTKRQQGGGFGNQGYSNKL
jgi:hypothetical protein